MKFKGGETLIGVVSFSEDEQRVISLGDDGRLQLWDATVGMLIPNEVSHLLSDASSHPRSRLSGIKKLERLAFEA